MKRTVTRQQLLQVSILVIGLLIGILISAVVLTRNKSVTKTDSITNGNVTTTPDCSKYLESKSSGLFVEKPECEEQLKQQNKAQVSESLPRDTSETQNSNSTNQNSSVSTNNANGTPTNTTNPSTSPTISCNELLKLAAIEKRESAIASENAKHSAWKYSGSYDSSYYQDAKLAEDNRYKYELAKIEYQYQLDISSAGCN